MDVFYIFAFFNPAYLGLSGVEKFPETLSSETAVARICRGAVRFEANAHVIDLM
jgi:hypothetical protein